MNIDKYKIDGIYKKEDCEYEDPIDFVQASILDFCCCGCPEDNLKYIRDVLEHINWKYGRQEPFDEWYKEWRVMAPSLFVNDGAEYFIYYVLAAKNLTEHGGSVPGWLTVEGQELLDDLNELFPKSK